MRTNLFLESNFPLKQKLCEDGRIEAKLFFLLLWLCLRLCTYGVDKGPETAENSGLVADFPEGLSVSVSAESCWGLQLVPQSKCVPRYLRCSLGSQLGLKYQPQSQSEISVISQEKSIN